MIKTIIHENPALTNPRIVILTGHSYEQMPLARLTTYSNVAEYAARWGHDLVILNGELPNGEYFPLFRLVECAHLAGTYKYDWIYVLGVDVMITNMVIPLSSITDDEYDLVISSDCNGWNADSFLLRSSPTGVAFINEIISQFEQYRFSAFKEQDAMFRFAKSLLSLAKVLPQRKLNAYDYDLLPERGGKQGLDMDGASGQWQPGDFLIHWAGLPLSTRIEQAIKMKASVIR